LAHGRRASSITEAGKQPIVEPPARRNRRHLAEQQTPSGATFIQMLKRRVTESHRFGVPLSILYLKIETSTSPIGSR